MSGEAAGTLAVSLDRELPSALPAGSRTSILCAGTCTLAGNPARATAIVVDGRSHRVEAAAMPRVGSDGRGLSPVGFWATVPVQIDSPGPIGLELEARGSDGTAARAKVGQIEVAAPGDPAQPGPIPSGEGSPLIAVCMATFEPDPVLFSAQVESLRSQTDEGWICVISDDASAEDRFQVVRDVVGADERFVVSRSDVRRGFYRNFERALELAPARAAFVALCDQDDRWDPYKLERLRTGIGSAQLVYSDQRLVDADGRVLRSTLWKGRSNNYESLTSMLVANTITGAATLFRKDLVDVLLPFPDTPGFQFHDHWLGIVALAAGDIAYIDEPLYDYVQHGGAVFGDVSSGATAPGAPRGVPGLRDRMWTTVVAERAAYFYGYLSRRIQAETVLLRLGDGIAPAKRRALERFIAAERSPAALARLAVRPVRLLAGRSETLGSEAQLAAGLVWRRLLAPMGHRFDRAILDTGIPAPGAFNQKRLRRWRGRL